jgi:hypothetical protein
MRTAAAIAVVAGIVAGCASAGDGEDAGVKPARVVAAERGGPRLGYLMLASGEVAALSLRTGRVVVRRDLGPSPRVRLATTLLSWGPGHRELYALSPRRADEVQRVRALDPATLSTRAGADLPADATFTAVAVGPRTGTVYLLGTREGEPLLATADPALDRVREPRSLREADGRDWLVIAATIDEGERRLAVSYHGETTTGADLVDLSAAPSSSVPVGCEATGSAGLGCFHEVHGDAAFVAGSLIATTGDRALVRYDPETGRLREHLDTELPKNHVMALASAGDAGVAVAGSCLQAGGLSVVSVGGEASRRGYPAAPHGDGYRGICGEGIATRGATALVAAPDTVGRGERPAGAFIVDLGRPKAPPRFVRVGSPLAVAL